MWTKYRRQAGVLLAILGIVTGGIAGCSQAPPPAPEKPAVLQHGLVKMQQLLEAHPETAKIRQMEQSLAAASQANASPSQAALDAAKSEFEAAMEVRRNQDIQALEQKEAKLKETLNEQRKVYIESLEAEYGSQLVNLDLKLKTVQYAPTELQKLQWERDRLVAERQQKLAAKDEELAAVFKKESSAFSDELMKSANAYADQWMKDRMARMRPETALPADLEKQRKELSELSERIMQDVRQAVAVVAQREKLDIVWVYPAVRQQAKDITDAVARELKK